MTDQIAQVSVRILDKEYQVACPAEERTDLLDSAEMLNAKMREIRDSGRIVGLDRIAVMAALNITNELLTERNSHGGDSNSVEEHIAQLSERIKTVLGDQHQLKL